MKIGVVGGGIVGSAVARSYVEDNDVRVYDALSTRRTHSLVDIFDCDVVFVCLPTPQKLGSLGADVSVVWDFFKTAMPGVAYVLKSTVPVGTTRALKDAFQLHNLVHSPEFLTARCSYVDAQLPSRNIVGGERPRSHPVWDLYSRRFPGVPMFSMSSNESEAVKLMQNSLFAVKIALWNAFREFAESRCMDWRHVQAAILADGRIAHSHCQVPGPDGRLGFGGSCLPKDLANLVDCMGGCEMLEAVLQYNRELRREG